jgi:hypothetical protein
MKLQMPIAAFMMVTLGLGAGCSEKRTESTTRSATGRGNGGNTKVSALTVERSLESLKEPLTKSFRALMDLALAEKILPGSTSLNGDEELRDLILFMTHAEEQRDEESDATEDTSVFADIQTPGNFELNQKGCYDYRNVENAAGTDLLGFGRGICFSLPRLTEQTLDGGETAFQIALLGLAAHEFVHHYKDLKDFKKTEGIAVRLQEFLTRELNRATVLSNENIISVDEYFYVEQFLTESEELLEQVKRVPPPIDSLPKKTEGEQVQ